MSAKQCGALDFATVSTLGACPELQTLCLDAIALLCWCRDAFGTDMTAIREEKDPPQTKIFGIGSLDGNLRRDRENQGKLCELGWRVFLIWECLLYEGTSDLLKHLQHMCTSYKG